MFDSKKSMFDFNQKQYEQCEPYIGCLFNHLRVLNFCAKNGSSEANLQTFLSNDQFRRDWLRILQNVTKSIRNARDQTSTDKCFASVTNALTVQLFSYVEDWRRGMVAFNGENVIEFLDVCMKRTSQNAVLIECFDSLKYFLELPNPERTAGITDKWRYVAILFMLRQQMSSIAVDVTLI